MKRVVNILNIIVFIAATIAIMGVFYEGMALEWFPIVGVLIIVMDYSFFLSTIINLVFYRKNKRLLAFSVFSLTIIIIALFMKLIGINYPIWSLVAWYFYIWFYYGYLISKQYL